MNPYFEVVLKKKWLIQMQWSSFYWVNLIFIIFKGFYIIADFHKPRIIPTIMGTVEL